MKSWISHPQMVELLDGLYADAAERDRLARQADPQIDRSQTSEAAHHASMRHRYMAVGREFGRLLYSLARGSKAKTVVEFGTSFGVSTIYLASAIRDNGEGKVITTEAIAEKSEQAKKNLAAAGLEPCVEFRVGDARNAESGSAGRNRLVLPGWGQRPLPGGPQDPGTPPPARCPDRQR
jgi:predicted O-methyltransferase YrrM